MTIQEYIARKRCEHATNMLKFTDYSVAVIAEPPKEVPRF